MDQKAFRLKALIYLDALSEAEVLTPKRLAAKYGDEPARWALVQVELRKRAAKKFGDLSARMLFEREALEQSTGIAVARYHASQFPVGVMVADLTAGIGGDALALGERGPVKAFESDPVRAELLEFNLADSGSAICGDGFGQVEDFDYVWVDPDRRDREGRRLTMPEDYTPNPRDLAQSLSGRVLAGIKLSPLLPDDYLEGFGGRLEFISYRGECLEAVIWLGTSILSPSREAVMIGGSGETFRYPASSDPSAVDVPSKYIFDCDPAVVRAHCTGGFGCDQLGDGPGYLTSESLIDSPALRAYEVLAVSPPDTKKLRAVLRENGWRARELKQRGAGLNDIEVLRPLPKEGMDVSLIAYRRDKSIRVAIAKSLAKSP